MTVTAVSCAVRYDDHSLYLFPLVRFCFANYMSCLSGKQWSYLVVYIWYLYLMGDAEACQILGQKVYFICLAKLTQGCLYLHVQKCWELFRRFILLLGRSPLNRKYLPLGVNCVFVCRVSWGVVFQWRHILKACLVTAVIWISSNSPIRKAGCVS